MGNKRKILFMTNVPSPYRVDFFNELGKYCDLTVAFEKSTSEERDDSWKEYTFKSFTGIILNGIRVDFDTSICFGIIKLLQDNIFDDIIISDFTSPTGMIAIEYLKLKKRKYWLESDGGFAKNSKGLKEFIKRHYIKGAYGYFSTASSHDKYYLHYGAKEEQIFRYPFTSLSQKDLLPIIPSRKEKNYLRERLNIREKYVFIVDCAIFTDSDVINHLINVARDMGHEYGFYTVGFNSLQMNMEHIHNCNENLLTELCRSADIYLMQKQVDNSSELFTALANGLPIIDIGNGDSTSRLIDYNRNAIHLPLNDETVFRNNLMALLNKQEIICMMGEYSRDVIAEYAVHMMPSDIYKRIIKDGYHGWIKEYLRKELRLNNRFIVLAVGQFIYRKGFDILLEAARIVKDNDVQFIFIGGEATADYLSYVQEKQLENVKFLGFKTKDELRKYYIASDIMIHPTREDIWGLVVNEAISCLCPVISTDRCIAAEQLVKPSYNGFIVPVENAKAIADSIILASELFDTQKCIDRCIYISREYTIERMALRHLEVLNIN